MVDIMHRIIIALIVLAICGLGTWMITISRVREAPGLLDGERRQTEFGGTVYSSPKRVTTHDRWAIWWNASKSVLIAVEDGGTTYGVGQDVWQTDSGLMVRTKERLVNLDTDRLTADEPTICIISRNATPEYMSVTRFQYDTLIEFIERSYPYELRWTSLAKKLDKRGDHPDF